MLYNVASLLKEPTGATRDYEVDGDVRIDGVPRHVTGHVRFDRTPRGIFARADVHGRGEDACSRCLKSIEFDVDITFEEEFVPTVDVNTGHEVEPPGGADEAYRIDEHHQIDLAEPVRDFWAVAAPMAPVCDAACAGICPQCGAEIGPDGHECEHEVADSRWAALEKLKFQ